MIKSFRSKALRNFFSDDDARGFDRAWARRIGILLDRLHNSKHPGDMNLPGFQFHPLKGGDKGRYAVSVSGNFRITFAFAGEDAVEVDLEDYH